MAAAAPSSKSQWFTWLSRQRQVSLASALDSGSFLLLSCQSSGASVPSPLLAGDLLSDCAVGRSPPEGTHGGPGCGLPRLHLRDSHLPRPGWALGGPSHGQGMSHFLTT